MLPKQIASFALILMVGLPGLVHAQVAGIPLAAPQDSSVIPPAQAAVPPLPETDSDPVPTWFADVDVFLVQPKTYIVSDGGVSKELRPYLHWTVAPQVTLGYQFAEGNAFLASYRYLASSATFRTAYSTFRTPLNTHWLDLDYRTAIYSLTPAFTLQGQGGCRLSYIDRDSQYDSSYESYRDESSFFGAGPHLGMNLAWYPGLERLGFFARTDIGVLVGESLYQGTSHYSNPPGSYYPGYAQPDFHYSKRLTQVVINPRMELGASWLPASQGWVSFEGGVRLDDFAQIDQSFQWASILHNLGPFVRCKFRF